MLKLNRVQLYFSNSKLLKINIAQLNTHFNITKCLFQTQIKRYYCTKFHPKAVIIAGPTASGKSALSLRLQSHYNAVLVNGDATKIYKGLDCGSNKLAIQNLDVRLRSIISPITPLSNYTSDSDSIPDNSDSNIYVDPNMSAGSYADLARKELESVLFEENRFPIVVGGSGLYLQWLMSGKKNHPPRDVELCKRIEQELEQLSWEEVCARVALTDQAYAASLSYNDRRRACRAIEIYMRTGKPISSHQTPLQNQIEFDDSLSSSIDFRPFCLDVPRTILYNKIAERCDRMIEAGLFKEVWGLMQQGLTVHHMAGKAIGYRQAIEYIESRYFTEKSFLEFVSIFKSKTRQLAHRQISWFRARPEFYTLSTTDSTSKNLEDIINLINSPRKVWDEAVRAQQLAYEKSPLYTNLSSELRTYKPPLGLFTPSKVSKKLLSESEYKEELNKKNRIQVQLKYLNANCISR